MHSEYKSTPTTTTAYSLKQARIQIFQNSAQIHSQASSISSSIHISLQQYHIRSQTMSAYPNPYDEWKANVAAWKLSRKPENHMGSPASYRCSWCHHHNLPLRGDYSKKDIEDYIDATFPDKVREPTSTGSVLRHRCMSKSLEHLFPGVVDSQMYVPK
jgi:hypothetical protein